MTGSVLHPRYHKTSRITWTRSATGHHGEGDLQDLGGVPHRVLDHRLGARQAIPLLARPAALALLGRLGPRVQGRLPVQRANHLEVLRPALQQRRVDVGRIADQPEGPARVGHGQTPRQFGGGLGAGLMPGLTLLAVESPQHRQAEVTVGTHRHRHSDAQDDPVEAEAQGLVPLRREDRVEEDAAEGDLGAALVAESVVDDQPHDSARDQVAQDQGGQNDAQVVPLPDGGMEHGIGRVVMPLGGQSGGLPDLADGARPEADDPTGEEGLKRGEDTGVKAVAEGLYQGGERGDKLIHRADLRAVSDPWVPEHCSGYSTGT